MQNRFLFDTNDASWSALVRYITSSNKDHTLALSRLLLPTLTDESFALQLHADLLLAFNEKRRAILLYEQAAQSYYEQKKLQQAYGIYDHLLLLGSNTDFYKNEQEKIALEMNR